MKSILFMHILRMNPKKAQIKKTPSQFEKRA